MAATYPTAVRSFTNVVNGKNIIDASDINSAYEEVEAVEHYLGTGVNLMAADLTNPDTNYYTGKTFASLDARVDNAEKMANTLTGGTQNYPYSTFTGYHEIIAYAPFKGCRYDFPPGTFTHPPAVFVASTGNMNDGSTVWTYCDSKDYFYIYATWAVLGKTYYGSWLAVQSTIDSRTG